MKTTRSTLLVLALSILGIGMVIVLGARLDRTAQEEIVAHFSQRQLLLAEQTAAAIQSIFDEARRDLLHIKGGDGPACLADVLGAENEEGIATCRGVTEQGFSSYLRSHPIYTQIRYVDASGREIVGVDSDGEAVRVIHQDKLRSQAEREFFVATMQLDEGEIYVSPLEPALGHGGVGTGHSTVRLATPVFDNQGRRQGIVVLSLLGDEIRAHVARLSVEEGVDVWVLDETGVEIINVAHPELGGSNAYEYCQQTGDKTLIALTEDMLAGGRGAVTCLWPESMGGPLAVKRLAAYTPVYPAEGHVWSVVTSVLYDSVLAAHCQTRMMLLILGGSIITIILAGAVLAVRSGYRRSVAEERARLSETLHRRGEELEALCEISLAVTAQLELDEVLQNVVERGCRLLNTRAGGIYLVDEARNDLEFVVSHGYTRDYTGTRLAPGKGVAGRILQSGAPLAVDDYSHWKGRSPDWEAEPLTAVLGVPLKRGEQVIGVLDFVEITQARSFDEHDLWLATLFANQAAIAIENARLYEQARHRLQILTHLNRASQVITSSLDVKEVLEQIVELAGSVVNSDHTSVILLDEEGKPVLGAGDFLGVPSAVHPIAQRIRSSGVTRHVLDSGQPVVVDMISDEGAMSPPLRRPDGELMEANLDIVAAGIRSFAAVPTQAKGRMLGVAFVHSRRPRAFHGQLPLLTTFANQAAVAIENARLYEQAQQQIAERKQAEEALKRRATQLATLGEIGQQITSLLELDPLLDHIVNLVREAFNYRCVSILLVDPATGELALRAGAGYELELVKPLRLRAGKDGICGWVATSGEPLLVGDVSQESRYYPVEMLPDTRSELAVPIQVKGQVIGVLDVQSAELEAFDEDDLSILQTLADQVGVAIENARLYEAEQRRRQEAETLRESALALTTSLDRNQVIKRILIQLQQVVPYDSASVQLLRGDYLEIIGGYGFPNLEELLGVTFDLRAEDNPNREVIHTRAPFILEDAPTVYNEFSREPHAKAAIRSWLGVPLLIGHRPIGMIALDKRELGFYTTEHARLAEAFAAQAAISIENARLYEEAKRRLDEVVLIQEVMLATASTFDFGLVLERTVKALHRALGIAGLGFLLPDERDRMLMPHPSLIGVAESTIQIPIAGSPAGRAYRTGQPVLVRDLAQEPLHLEHVPEVRSALAVPVRVGDRIIAVLHAESPQVGAFDEDELRLFTTVAGQLGMAMENTRLYQELRTHAEQLEERVQERTAEVQAQYARLQAVLRSASDGIVVTDEKGKILQINPVAQTWLTQTLPPEDARELREAVGNLAQRAKERPEIVLELKGLDLQLNAAPISEPGLEEAATVVAVHDVSHLKALDRLKSRFVSNVSHELRTPIAAIKLYLALMRRRPGKWGEYLDALEREAEQQARLVEDILQISRIDAGRLELKPRPILLNELTDAAVVGHQVLAENRRLTLEYQPAEPGPVALADTHYMMQVLNNLIVNSIRYTPEGGRVVVSTGKQDAKGRVWATATVTDTGIGIPEEELPHVFERFFRGEGPRLMQVPGTGLGLAIVKEIMELHGGMVTVESQVKEGTTFTVWLPLTG